MENFNFWHWVVLFLLFFSLVIEASHHGEVKKERKYDFFERVFFTAISLFLWYKCGAFNF